MTLKLLLFSTESHKLHCTQRVEFSHNKAIMKMWFKVNPEMSNWLFRTAL